MFLPPSFTRRIKSETNAHSTVNPVRNQCAVSAHLAPMELKYILITV